MKIERIFEKGDIVIYENRRCKILSITENRVELSNLDMKKGDWSKLIVEINDEKEDYNSFFTKCDYAEDKLSKIRMMDDK